MSEAARFSGSWFDGRTARQQEVAVFVGDAGVVICDADGAERAHWPADEVRLAKRRPGEPLRLRRGENDAARLTITDMSALGALLKHCPQLDRRPGRLRDHWRQVALWGGGAVAAIVFLLFVGVPWLATVLADAVPPETEARWGGQVVEQMAGIISRFYGGGAEPKFCNSPAGQAALDRLVARLTDGRDEPIPLRVRVLDLPAINAITLPGGQILVLSGLLKEATDSSELAGVLAHEIGHVEHRHPLQGAFNSIGTAALLSFVVGDITGGTLIVAASQAMIEGSFSRDAEREADSAAVAMLNMSDITAEPMARFFDRLAATQPGESDLEAMITTHPPSAERAAAIRAAATGHGAAMPEADWQALRHICGD